MVVCTLSVPSTFYLSPVPFPNRPLTFCSAFFHIAPLHLSTPTHLPHMVVGTRRVPYTFYITPVPLSTSTYIIICCSAFFQIAPNTYTYQYHHILTTHLTFCTAFFHIAPNTYTSIPSSYTPHPITKKI